MDITLMRSKIHRATVTDANLNYVGSITIDKDLIDASGMYAYEQVHVLNVTNGHRLITYVMEGERGSGIICLNGAAARLTAVKDIVIIIAYGQMGHKEAATFKPAIVFVDEHNKIKGNS